MNYRHPVDVTYDVLVKYFVGNGFQLKLFNEIRTVEEEFESVGIYKDNPVRDFDRTFYLDDEHVLQAHMTSIREMVKTNKSGKYIIPGRIYRYNDEKSIRTTIAHQIEGCVFGELYSLNEMNNLIRGAFLSVGLKENELVQGSDFTRFTSPTIQYYYKCHFCKGVGCKICEYKGVLCFAAGGCESESWDSALKATNISFCLSVDRLAMRKYKIADMRKIYEG